MVISNTTFGGVDWPAGTALASADLNDTFDAVGLSKISSTTISGSDVTSVDFTSLDIDTDGIYVLIIEMQEATGNAIDLSIYINDDTTATNYYRQYVNASNSSLASDRTNEAIFGAQAANESGFYYLKVFRVKPQGFFFAQCQSTKGASAAIQTRNATVTRYVDANITKITITASTASSIKIGSVLSLYRVTR